MVVEEVEPPSRFSFRWCHPEGEEPVRGNSVMVQFTLAAQGTAGTRLAVRETGVGFLDWPDEDKERFAEDHRGGWATIVGRLQSLFEAGACES